MAKLEGLKDFDMHFRLAAADFNRLTGSRGSKQGTWSAEQEVQISQILGTLRHLYQALELLVHHNR